jgi:hypothetical protein
LPTHHERQFALLNLTLGYIPEEHRVTRLETLQPHKGLGAVCNLLSPRSQHVHVLVLGEERLRDTRDLQGLHNLRTKDRLDFRMVGHALSCLQGIFFRFQ